MCKDILLMINTVCIIIWRAIPIQQPQQQQLQTPQTTTATQLVLFYGYRMRQSIIIFLYYSGYIIPYNFLYVVFVFMCVCL